MPNDPFTLLLSLSLGWENLLPAWLSPWQAPSPRPGLLYAAPSMTAAQIPTEGFFETLNTCSWGANPNCVSLTSAGNLAYAFFHPLSSFADVPRGELYIFSEGFWICCLRHFLLRTNPGFKSWSTPCVCCVNSPVFRGREPMLWRMGFHGCLRVQVRKEHPQEWLGAGYGARAPLGENWGWKAGEKKPCKNPFPYPFIAHWSLGSVNMLLCRINMAV